MAMLSLAAPAIAGHGDDVLANIKLPAGLAIDYYARDVRDARSLALGPAGTVFVGSRRGDTVTALRDEDGDGHAEVRHLIADGLNVPNGIAVLGGDLYVAENHRVVRYAEIEKNLRKPRAPEEIITGLPRERHHGWRYLAAGPDGWLYMSIGAPCNVCERDGFAHIERFRPDGRDREVVARGVRNSVGFTWHPATREMWFTDNGRDWLGDDSPPCELNRLARPGSHFGFPYCHGRDVADPKFDARKCEEFEPSIQPLGAHVAPLGLKFYDAALIPGLRGRLLIAEHGSWNRSEKVGYRVTAVRFDAKGDPAAYEVFASGWLQPGDKVLGRPVDLLVMPDGAILVSDDHRDAIYRIAPKP